MYNNSQKYLRENRSVKNLSIVSIFFFLVIFFSCATVPNSPSGLLSFDEAMSGIENLIKDKLAIGTEVAIAAIDSPTINISEYLTDELSDRFSIAQMKVLARGKELRSIDNEHNFQMSGMVSDETAVGIGRYIGAKVVITGTFSYFSNFSQLRLRAVDVETSAILATYSPRIGNNGPILIGLTKALEGKGVHISEKSLGNINRGKDFYSEGKLDQALSELDTVIANDPSLSEAYYWRGMTYFRISHQKISSGDNDGINVLIKSLDDYSEVIRLDDSNFNAYNNRANIYYILYQYEEAIADYDKALKINPKATNIYRNRGYVQMRNNHYRLAIDDFNTAISINPRDAETYNMRGLLYKNMEVMENAMSDYNMAIALDPTQEHFYINRAELFVELGDFDKAIIDYSQAIGINPNVNTVNIEAVEGRFIIYCIKGNYQKAQEDFAILDMRGWEPPEWFIKSPLGIKIYSDMKSKIDRDSLLDGIWIANSVDEDLEIIMIISSDDITFYVDDQLLTGRIYNNGKIVLDENNDLPLLYNIQDNNKISISGILPEMLIFKRK
jgi:tetratricopeptide (TPR) repeat protein